MSSVAESTSLPAARTWRRSPVWRGVKRVPFLVLIAAIFVYALFPFYWALRSAFTPEGQLFTQHIHYLPTHFTLNNFRDVLKNGDFQHALINSTLVALAVVLLALAVGSLAAYALGRFRFRGRSATLYLMLSMTIFPQIAILGALYTMINDLGIFNTLWSLIMSYMIFTLPFTVWVLTSFMRALPKDLEEAAYIDGATPLQVFYKVLLPLVLPGLVTTGLLAFVASWNEFLYALSFTETPEKRTVPVALSQFVGRSGYQTPWAEIMAATVTVTVPVIVLVLALQRRILAGLTAGAVKG